MSYNTKIKDAIDELSHYLLSNPNGKNDSVKDRYIENVKSFARALTIQQIDDLQNESADAILTNPEKMKEEFEKFLNRNEVDDYLEYWAGKMSLKYDPKDIIHLPRYKTSDIQALFIKKKLNDNRNDDQENSISAGIKYSLTIAPSPDLINSLSKLQCEKYKTLLEYLDEVSKITLEVLFNKHVDENFEDALKKENIIYNEEIVNFIIKLYPICRAQDTREPINFTFEDLFFLRSNWGKEKELCAKYPSLTYWLISNQECQRKLRFHLKELKIQEDSIPLFLHILRIFSSMKCIEFKSNLHNDTSMQISQIILENLKPKIKVNNSCSMKWLNLLLPNVPIDFYDFEVSLIYDFFKSISSNQNSFKSETCQACQTDLFKIIIKEMINSVFEDKIHLYYTDELNDQFSSFIKNPHELIQQKIEQELKKDQQNILAEIKKILQNNIKSQLENLKKIIQNDSISKAIDEDIKERINNELNNDKSTKMKEFSDKESKYQQNVQKYQNNFKKFLNNNLDQDSAINNNDLKGMFESKQYFLAENFDKIFDKDQDPIKISYIYDEISNIYKFIDPNNEDGNDENENNQYDNEIENNQDDNENDNFQDDNETNEYDENHKNESNNDKNPNDRMKKLEILFFPLSDKSKIEIKEQFEKEKIKIDKEIESNRSNLNKDPPKLDFGDFKVTQKNYPLFVRTIFDNINTFLSDILYNRSISKDFFDKLQGKIETIFEDINQIKEINNAKFYSTFVNASKTTNIINLIKAPILQFETYFIQIRKFVRDIISKKLQINLDIENSLIPITYTLPDIKTEKEKDNIYKISFDEKNLANLATPYISLSPNHEITCCVKPFNPIIDPIIPDLYESKRIFIKILSFVPKEVQSSIIMDNECQEFSTIPTSQAYKPIKISFSIPPYNENISNEINFTGNLKITSKDIIPLTLPCQFTLQFLPLRILVDSPEYQLMYINKSFRISCNKFTPKQEIKINLSILNFQLNHNFTISMRSFPDNKANEPKCTIEKTGMLTIQIPQNSNNESCTYIHGLINVNIIPKLIIPFEIDAEIIENKIDFYIYDHIKKEFCKDLIYVYCQKNKSIKYYCYVNANFEIEPKDIESNLKKKESKNVNITIGEIQMNKNSLIYFDVEIIMEEGITNYDISSISFKVKGIEKNIQFNFIKSDINLLLYYNEIYIQKTNYNDMIKYMIYNYNYNYNYSDNFGFDDITKLKISIDNYMRENNPVIFINTIEVIIKNNPKYEIESDYKINYQKLSQTYWQIPKKSIIKNVWQKLKNSFTGSNESSIENGLTKTFSKLFPNILGYVQLPSNKSRSKSSKSTQNFKWFPLCNQYIIKDFDRLDISSNEENKETEAIDNLTNFLMQLCFNLDFNNLEVINLDVICQTIFDNIDKIPITNFAPIAASIVQKDFDIDSFYSKMPSEIINELSIKKPPAKPSIIDLHNFIMDLYSAFHKKYLELEQYNFYLFLEIKWDKIEEIRKKIFNMEIPPEEQFLNKIEHKKKLDQLSSSRKIIDSGTRSNLWIFLKNSEPQPLTKYTKDSDINVFKTTSNEISSDSADLINDISKTIEIPDLSSVKTIEDKIKTLGELTSISQSLPFSIYVFKKNPEGLRKIENCFNSLVQVYFQCISYKSSFLENNIKSFTNSFEQLCTRLSQSNIKFNGPKTDFLFKKTSFKQNIQDYLEMPDPIIPPQPINYWNIYKSHTHDKLINMLNYNYLENKNEQDDMNKNKNFKTKVKKLESNLKEINLTESQGNRTDNIKSYSDELIGETKDEKKVNVKMVSIKSKDGRKFAVSSDKLEEVRTNFKGEDMIAGIVSRIQNFELNGILRLPEEFGNAPPSEYLNQKYDVDAGSEAVPIKKMIDLTDHLTSQFIQNGIDSECSLKNTCGIILIECSQTLSPSNKLSCVMLATSIAKAFNALEMPYSVVVFADYKFQFEIKKFDEIHSDDVIQKILDSVKVERFAPRIADACYFAKKNINCPNRSNRAFFVISDGLDPYMKCIDGWKKDILNEEQDIFAFFILRSAYLNDEQYKVVNKMLEDFNNGVSDSVSLTRYMEFTSDSIFTGNANISIKFLLEQLKNSSKELEKYEFKSPIEYKDEINKLAIDHVESNIKSIYDEKITDIYIKNDDIVEQSKGISFPSFQITSNYLVSNKTEDEENLNEMNKDIVNFSKPKNDQWKEVIFAPNKPSQYAPSTRGTKLYLQGFIKFCITDGQENKIWLEKIAGLKRNYRISVVIDASNSCFNDLMYNHSLLTIITFLRTLATVEIPYFDLIVATADGPQILAINQNTQNCLDPNGSDLWISLFSTFEKHDAKCNLYDAILCAMKLKSTISTKKSFLFVFTDGLYDENEQTSLKNLILACRESSISVFGIGIGLYPKGIERIFQKCLWSINPAYIITAISKFFGNETPSKLKEINALFGPPRPDIADIKIVLSKICDRYPGTIIYKKLNRYLYDQTLYKESCPDFQPEKEGIDSSNTNAEWDDKSTMYAKDAFKGQKILICAYWSKSIAGKDESEWVDPIYLTQRYNDDNTCVSEVLQYYGFEVTVVQSYKQAITELKSGQYIEAWIICGDSSNKLPDKTATANGEAYLVDQFVDCVEYFWKSGGSVAWWCDNDPLFFQANLFLERAEFPGEVTKTNLRLVKGYEGLKYMKAGDISTIKKSVFDNKKECNFGKYTRYSISHNLVSLSEGSTISRANDPNNIAPFKPFAYDSEGGLVSLYFDSKSEDTRGDIFIDCGFTKLFNELKYSENDGTIRYVQNIAARMAQYEKHLRDYGEKGPRIYKPSSFDFTINESLKFDRITSPDFDIIYMIDATGSMGSYLKAAADQCINISKELKEKLPDFNFQFGAIFYRDPVDSPSDIHEKFLLSNDINLLQRNIAGVSPDGGGDGPEDWVAAYEIALDQINWRKGVRLIIHMADAPAHGHSYCGYNNHEEENDRLAPLLKRCCSCGIKIVGMPIDGDYSLQSFKEAERNYNCGSNEQKFYRIQSFDSGSSNLSSYFKDQIVTAAVCAAPKS